MTANDRSGLAAIFAALLTGPTSGSNARRLADGMAAAAEAAGVELVGTCRCDCACHAEKGDRCHQRIVAGSVDGLDCVNGCHGTIAGGGIPCDPFIIREETSR